MKIPRGIKVPPDALSGVTAGQSTPSVAPSCLLLRAAPGMAPMPDEEFWMEQARPVAQNAPLPRLFECAECGQRYEFALPSRSFTAKCRRCGATLLHTHPDSLQWSLALTATGLVLIGVANTLPFMSMTIAGRYQGASLVTGDIALYNDGLWPLAALVLFTTIVAPALKLGAIAYVLVGVMMRHPPPGLARIFGWLERLRPWSMIEVYLLGVFVAYVKLAALATIDVGVACYSLGLLMLVMVCIDSVLSPEQVWQAMENRGLVRRAPAPEGGRLLLCETCGMVAPAAAGHGDCPRCGAQRHFRKPNSMARAWALVLTALALYFPANIFPVMTLVSFGKGESDTILSGVKTLFYSGMWPLALLVFFASITVPVLKIVCLIFLLVSTRRGSRWRLRDRTLLFRIVESIGRWSMIDIFMLSILAGLVQLGSIATIQPGVGAVSFAAVVIVTMFAAACFDPRLMWDAAGENR
jgi:paraquat-inducible protein A